jgi:protease-4
MTGPEREELTALLQSIYGQIIEGIAADRKLEPDVVRALVDRAPLLLDEAVKAHLIDHVGDRENALASLGGTSPLLSLERYLDQVGPPHQSGPTIALIYATGLMARGGGGGNPLTGDQVLGADELTRAFRLAQMDKSVRAILFRIDSPGGSAVAAETIWAAVRRARDAGKPVIVSMGDVAGSGGYYVAAPADSIQIGANASVFSFLEDFTPAEHERLEAVLDSIYGTFKSRVAEGRKLDAAAVEAVAKGRVWSGEDASTRGLVDTLGGFKTALDLAKQAAGVPADQDVTLKPYPAPKSSTDLLLARLRGGGGDDDESILPSRMIAFLRASAQRLGLVLAPPGALTMRPFDVR